MNNIEQKLKSNSLNKRIDALFDAFEFGDEGIRLIIPVLQDKDNQVREAALLLLSESKSQIAKQAISNYSLSQIKHLHTVKKIEVDTQILPSYFAIADFNQKLVCYWELDYKRAFVQLWDLKTGKSENHSDLGTHWLKIGNQGKICIVNFQDDFRFLNLYDNYVDKYYSPKNKYIRDINMCNSFVLCPGTKKLAASGISDSGSSRELKVVDYKNNRCIFIYKIERGLYLCEGYFVYNRWKEEVRQQAKWLHDTSALFFTPDDRFLISNFIQGFPTRSNLIRIWHIETGDLIKTVDNLPLLAITSLGINFDDKIIACGIREDRICVWELLNDSIICTFDEIAPCILTNDGRVLIYATHNYEIIIRDLIHNKTINTLQGHMASIIHLSMSRDEQFIASYDENNTIKIWGIT